MSLSSYGKHLTGVFSLMSKHFPNFTPTSGVDYKMSKHDAAREEKRRALGTLFILALFEFYYLS